MKNIENLQFNLQDSPIDERDHIYSNICGISNEELPKKFINKHLFVKNQNIPKPNMKCVGYAISSLMESKEMMRLNTDKIDELSPQFIYYNSGRPNENGTIPRDALDGLVKYGTCKDTLCKVEGGNTLESMNKPSNEAYKDAEKRKADGYAKLYDVEDIKKAIVKDGGAIVSMMYYASMLSPTDGYISEPSATTKKLGLHCKLIVGYDDEHIHKCGFNTYKGFFIQLNSWGENQGVFGIEYIPYAFITEKWCGGLYRYGIDRVFREAWAIYDKTNVINDKFHYNNQPNEVIAKPKSVNMILKPNDKNAIIDGKTIQLDVAPIIKNNVTYVPLRFVSEQLGCSCEYKEMNGIKNIFIRDLNTGRKVDFMIGYTIGYVNGKEYIMIQPPFVDEKSGRTMIPLRAISECLGCTVKFEGKTNKISITR